MRNVPFGLIKEHVSQWDSCSLTCCWSPQTAPSTVQTQSACRGQGVHPPNPGLIAALLSTRHGVSAWCLAKPSQHHL